jgi:hypothetical protein
MKNILLVLSTVIMLWSYILGIYSIIRGNFRPQRMTRFLILVFSAIYVISLFVQGDRNAIWLALVSLISTLVIFLLSIKKGMGGFAKLDIIVLVIVVFSIIVWKITNNPVLGLTMSLVADLTSYIPTFVKVWKFPETEEWKFYASVVLANFLNLLSISNYTFSKIILQSYLLGVNATIILIIVFRERILKKNICK